MRGWFTLVTPLLLAATSGCIIIPLPHAKRPIEGSRQDLGESAATVLKRPAATRADVISALGEPDLSWDNDRVFVYRWSVSDLAVLVAAGGGYSGTAGIAECPAHYFVLVEFDKTGRVRRWEQRKGPWYMAAEQYTKEVWRTW